MQRYFVRTPIYPSLLPWNFLMKFYKGFGTTLKSHLVNQCRGVCHCHSCLRLPMNHHTEGRKDFQKQQTLCFELAYWHASETEAERRHLFNNGLDTRFWSSTSSSSLAAAQKNLYSHLICLVAISLINFWINLQVKCPFQRWPYASSRPADPH